MKSKISVLSMVMFAFAALSAEVVCSAAMESFSADMVTKSPEGSFTGKIYSSIDKVRMEMPQSIVITRMDKKVSWVVMPSQGMYMEQAIDPSQAARTSAEIPGEIERISMGPDTVSGKSAEKFKVTYMSNGSKVSIYQWITNEWPVPVKSEAIDASWSVEYSNINVGPQASDLFEVPAGYQKFQMPNMAQMAQAAAQTADQSNGE